MNPWGDVSSDYCTMSGYYTYRGVQYDSWTVNWPRKKTSRSGHSSNPLHPISGSQTLWRSPSSYSNARGSYNPLPGTYSKSSDRWVNELPASLDLVYQNTSKVFPSLGRLDAYSQTNLRNRAQTECLLKLKDQKADIGANLATAMDTYSLLSSNAETLFRLFIAAKKGNWRSLRRILNTKRGFTGSVADRYLEFIFGVKPLMSDIYGSYQLLNEQVNQALIVSAVRNVSENRNDKLKNWASGAGKTWSCTSDAKIRVSCKLYATLSSEYARQLARAGMTNPASIVWEVIPWSFVIDWAIPVGNVLSAMDATYGLNFLGGYVGTRISETFSCSMDRGSFVGSLPANSGTKDSYQRSYLSGFPTAVPYYKSPFTNSHSITALALLRQLF